MPTAIHLNLRVDPTQYIPQIREVPGYDYLHFVRQSKYMTDLSLLNEKVYYLDEIFSPKEFVEKHNVTLLHAHHAQLGMLLLPFKDATNLPLVTSIRGRDATMANQPADYMDHMKMLFAQGERFFPVCQYLADRMIEWGCPPEKIRVLFGGVDLDQYQYSPPNQGDSQNILSVGRLIEKKGHHVLMKAFKIIQDKFPNATLTVIGKGELEGELRSLAKKLKLGKSFRLLNHLPKEMIREHMRNADLFCAASLTAANGDLEGIPNTLKEAMALGTPVISTYHAGIPELVTHGQEGFLVQENNVEELASALEYMLTHRDLWEPYTIAARQKVEQSFDAKQQLLLQANYYDELLDERYPSLCQEKTEVLSAEDREEYFSKSNIDFRNILVRSGGSGEGVKIENSLTEHLIGSGHQGAVFRVSEDQCVKIYGRVKHAIQEQKVLLEHQDLSFIPKVYETGPNYVLMEYLQGPDLNTYLKKQSSLSEEVARCLLEILTTMKAAGFKQIDAPLRHIIVTNTGFKLVDHVYSYTKDKPRPLEMFQNLHERQFLNAFLEQVKAIDPATYREWTKRRIRFDSKKDGDKKRRHKDRDHKKNHQKEHHKNEYHHKKDHHHKNGRDKGRRR